MTDLPPGYVRPPWPLERRKKASAAAIARSGAKPGHRICYGINVPEPYWPLISFIVTRYRNLEKRTLKETKAYVQTLLGLLP